MRFRETGCLLHTMIIRFRKITLQNCRTVYCQFQSKSGHEPDNFYCYNVIIYVYSHLRYILNSIVKIRARYQTHCQFKKSEFKLHKINFSDWSPRLCDFIVSRKKKGRRKSSILRRWMKILKLVYSRIGGLVIILHFQSESSHKSISNILNLVSMSIMKGEGQTESSERAMHCLKQH